MIELEDLVSQVDYDRMSKDYTPSKEALEFITFIKLVNGSEGEENTSPLIHFYMIDQMIAHDENLFVAARGTAKTTLVHEYLFLYLAVYGTFFDFGEVNVAFYVSDTIDNGVKSMRSNLEFRYNKSAFLQKYIPYTRFTDVRWEFRNIDGKYLCVRGFGANTGVRGFKEYGQRPTWAGFDDLMSDKNAESPTITRDIKNIIYKAARQALHPKKRKLNWTGTPFNKKDPLYEAGSNGGWTVSAYPLAQEFSGTTTKEDFRGAWEDRFPYEFVKKEYDKLLASGEIAAFNQELMLRISSEDDRIVSTDDIVWFKRADVLAKAQMYSWYVTTDYTTTGSKGSDLSGAALWAITSNGDWLLVDVRLKKMEMTEQYDTTFQLVDTVKKLGCYVEVGIEVDGQQKAHVHILKELMVKKNSYFTIAKQKGKNTEGILSRSVRGSKHDRFMLITPRFQSKKIWFAKEIQDTASMKEMIEELTYTTFKGFSSKYDDGMDLISQLGLMDIREPSTYEEVIPNREEGIWDIPEVEDHMRNNNSTVF